MDLNKDKIIFDGAMGTQLQSLGLRDDPVLLNLSHPEEIINIHKQYLEAGADIITSNTFGAYAYKYENAAEIIKSAISHARKALKEYPSCLLALDLGPTGLMLEPYGDTTHEETTAIFEEAIKSGIESGVDLILIETMMDPEELRLAVEAAKTTSLPIIATMSFNENGRTMMGTSVQDMVFLLEGLEVTAIGMNCGFGPDIYAKLLPSLKSNLPIILQPNAGLPIVEDGTVRYNQSPEDYAKIVTQTNVKIMGGCCGTTPAHIAALARMVK
ncbi:MAG: homocysteine S-methyltransferase family protein [Defluviitaleaceae bacterium]|nr:homocysteine S-methyltransferase family protein [Defluviitaleaceae bacterium]